MPDASIAMTIRENFIEKIEAMRSAGGRFSKELDEIEASAKAYGDRMDALSEQQATLQVQLLDAQKALAAAKKEYKDTGTQEAQEEVKKAQSAYNNLQESLKYLRNATSTTRKGFLELREELEQIERAGPEAAEAVEETAKAVEESVSNIDDNLRRMENNNYGTSDDLGAGIAGAGGGSNMLTALARSGLIQMLGSSASSALSARIGSQYGDEAETYFNNILGGVTSGAAMGSVAGPWGALAGAVVGGISGLIDSATEIFERKDDAFVSYVKDQYDTLTQAIEDTLAAGIEVAGSREQARVAFARRFGSEEAADEYLGRVQSFAAETNYSYDEIVGYSKQLLNTYDPEQVFSVLMSLSDASAGLDLESSDVNTLIKGLARMRTTDKATQEYLNYFRERGVDVDLALANATGVDKSQITDMVSKGEIGGIDAAQAILDYINQEFGGLSETLAGTYDAMVDNLEDAQTNLDAAMGEGFTQTRMAGLQAQQEFLEGAVGQSMEDAYGMIGQWKASLENLQEEYNRDALTAVMGGGVSENFMQDGELTKAGERLAQMSVDYQELMSQYEAGNQEAGAQMGALLAEAQSIAINEYNASTGMQTELESQLGLIENLREDAALQEAYWNAGYTMGQEFSKGLADAIKTDAPDAIDSGAAGYSYSPAQDYDYYFDEWGNIVYTDATSHADGLSRVPYDGYPAILHRDERVLTASEARSYDAGGGVTVSVTGNTINVRDQNDVDAIASAIAEKVVQAQQLRG